MKSNLEQERKGSIEKLNEIIKDLSSRNIERLYLFAKGLKKGQIEQN